MNVVTHDGSDPIIDKKVGLNNTLWSFDMV